MAARGIYKVTLLIAMTLATTAGNRAQILAQTAEGKQNSSQRSKAKASLEVTLKGANGSLMVRAAIASLIGADGQIYREEVSQQGRVRLENIEPAVYELRILAPGFATRLEKVELKNPEKLKLEVVLEAMSEEGGANSKRGQAALSPKAQLAVTRATEALLAKKYDGALAALTTAMSQAPQSADVQFLFGVYQQLHGRPDLARSYWKRALELDPRHYRSLIALSESFLRENKTADAKQYIETAVHDLPNAWLPRALLAEAELKQGLPKEAIEQAERAQELGHGQGAVVQLIAAAARTKLGQRETAAEILKQYTRAFPADEQAKRQLEALSQANEPDGREQFLPSVNPGLSELLPSSWLPLDVDESVGLVESGVSCDVEKVLKQTGERVQEFVRNVDRFTAMEFVEYESVSKAGIPGPTISRKFNYLVGMKEEAPGRFNVEEFRKEARGRNEFLDGVATHGLPALLLIFHPHNVDNFEIACEGRVRWGEGKAWQLHFRQRTDRPNTIRQYRAGLKGQAYPINLKGRAWVAADTFQIVRLESQMIAPISQINLLADDTAIEYGPVRFKAKKVMMWLPRMAEVYSDGGGHRFHQSHTFSNYALFSVDEKQSISEPVQKAETEMVPQGAGAKPD